MRWERFFEDLENQLDSEWEAERAVLDTEAERLRLARIRVRERLVALAEAECAVSVDLVDGVTLVGRVQAAGGDWIALVGDGSQRAMWLVPLAGIVAFGMSHADMLDSARRSSRGSAIRERMDLGFVARDLARRRVPVSLQVRGGRQFSGTIDRAGADHLDLALHDAGAPRRADAVLGHRVVQLTAVLWLRPDAAAHLP